MSAARKYTSAIDRLRQLPAIFVGTDLTLRFGWSPAAASVYLSQWRKSQLVRSLGGDVLIMPLVPGRSTTSLLRRILESE